MFLKIVDYYRDLKEHAKNVNKTRISTLSMVITRILVIHVI